VVSRSDRHAQRESSIQPAKLFRRQRNFQCPDIFFQIARVLGSRYGDNIFTLGEHPGQSRLRRRTADLYRKLLYRFSKMQVVFEVLALEARVVTPPVVLGNIFRCFEAPGQKAPASGL